MSTLSVTSRSESHHRQEVESGRRFQFGKNWQHFLTVLNEERIQNAARSLRDFLRTDALEGKSFLDVGSGSGLFSLAARRLGAPRVHSFDYDPQSVACAGELRERYHPGETSWTVEQGSALDADYLAGLGTFDVVYSWGVLHHTGAMWQALGNMVPLVKPGGVLYIAIYKDLGGESKRWRLLKQIYNRLPGALKLPYALAILLPREARRALIAAARLRPLDYIRGWTDYSRLSVRGMSRWHDLIDWIGGYPYEVAKPEEVFHFYRDRGFVLENLSTTSGCNEYLFRRPA